MTNNEVTLKKTTKELNDEFKAFWEPYFKENNIENPIFYAKLGYVGNEFALKGQFNTGVLRFYEDQLSKNQDIYIELFNYKQKPYHENKRVLYKFANNPDWKDNTDNYVLFTTQKDGTLLKEPSYSFQISSLELLVMQSSKFSEMQLETKISDEDNEVVSPLDYEPTDFKGFENYIEKDDIHYSQMTIRDIYCIIQNTPMSNKEWLNNLINEGTSWQIQKKKKKL